MGGFGQMTLTSRMQAKDKDRSFILILSCPRCCKFMSIGPPWAKKWPWAGRGTKFIAWNLKGEVKEESLKRRQDEATAPEPSP